jgi:hypothetical protein
MNPNDKWQKNTDNPTESYCDFNWNDFVTVLFKQPPQSQNTFRLEALQELSHAELSKMLGELLIHGAQVMYSKQLAELAPDEIDELKKYLASVGFTVEFNVTSSEEFSPAYGRKVPVNRFQIQFIPLPEAMKFCHQVV